MSNITDIKTAVDWEDLKNLPATIDTKMTKIGDELSTHLVKLNNMETANGNNSNVWISDDTGKQSLMVRIPRFKIDDNWHPAFIVNGVVKDAIYISKYQNIVENSRAYSLPNKDPRTSITFDQARLACEVKGPGWHLMSNVEWAAIALWSKKNETIPLGNNYSGSDYTKPHLSGSECYTWKLNYSWNGRHYHEDPVDTYWHTGRTLTGSSPNKFSHNHQPDGIFDLNGNVWEWVSGLRLKDGEIQVIPDNNSAGSTSVDMSVNSVEWRAILQDGSYVNPGSIDTLKIDNTTPNSENLTGNVGGDPILDVLIENPNNYQSTDSYLGYSDVPFKDFTSRVTIPHVLKQLCIVPDLNTTGDRLYVRNYGERLPFRGGTWNNSSSAGVFALSLHAPRSHSHSSYGFRSAFVL